MAVSNRGRPRSVSNVQNKKRDKQAPQKSTRKKSVSSLNPEKRIRCDREQKGKETENDLQGESSTSTSLPVELGVESVGPISSSNNQTFETSSHSRNSSSSSLTSLCSGEEQDVTIAPPVTEGHVKRLAYPISFFKYHGPSRKPGNSLYICTVKGCKRDKPLSTVDNSRGNLRAHVKWNVCSALLEGYFT